MSQIAQVRPPAVAGTFYPDEPTALSQTIGRLLKTAAERLDPGLTCTRPKVIVAPHAGYTYSGELAALCYAPLGKKSLETPAIKRVVLLGPAHRVAFRGIALPSSTAFRTPLGDVPIDSNAISALLELPDTGFLDEAHGPEHSLEVHLPFLQTVLGDFSLVPLVVGEASPDQVALTLNTLWGDEATLIIISTDLSHFHDAASAERIDANTMSKILAFSSELTGEEACGCRPLNGLLTLASRRGLTIQPVGRTHSGETSGDRRRVVGYGGFYLYEKPQQEIPIAIRQQVLQVARQSIDQALKSQAPYQPQANEFEPWLASQGACFVSLHQHHELRGCIGSLEAHRPLLQDIAENARAAAFQDPRFPPLTPAEWQSVDLEVSVLSEPEALGVLSLSQCLKILRPGVDGIILQEGQQRATFLPSVWDQLPDPEQFLRALRQKAGLRYEPWENCQVWRYTTRLVS